MSEPRFALYGEAMGKGITLDELLAIQATDQSLWAHAELSGCESCYCEVARWNYQSDRHERFAFLKCLDYRPPGMPDASDVETAEWLAKQINGPSWFDEHTSIVHRLPDWKATKTPDIWTELKLYRCADTKHEALDKLNPRWKAKLDEFLQWGKTYRITIEEVET